MSYFAPGESLMGQLLRSTSFYTPSGFKLHPPWFVGGEIAALLFIKQPLNTLAVFESRAIKPQPCHIKSRLAPNVIEAGMRELPARLISVGTALEYK
jgi:hypothetical protein